MSPKSKVVDVMSWYREVLSTLSCVLTAQCERTAQEQKKADRLAGSISLYDLDFSSRSVKIRRHLKYLNIPVTIKSLNRCNAYQKELLNGGGRAQVPCLRIESKDGTRWIYDRVEIMAYLNRKFEPKCKAKEVKIAR